MTTTSCDLLAAASGHFQIDWPENVRTVYGSSFEKQVFAM